ncbi:MAG: trehalose-phosphatase, partial [Candidatus Competibacteraceae bacterium]|nr:trehalose-phosphatase [Candidatus Competibacteraceae bacterium]
MASVSRFLIERLVEAYQQGRRLALVFDYDGTLTPFAARPELARLDSATRGALAGLAATPRVAVGVVSGRALADLKAMVGLPGLDYGGSWGLELESRGRRLRPEPAEDLNRLLVELAVATEARLPAYPGAWLEKKAWGLTLHYREANPDQIEALRAEFLTLLAPRAAAVRFYQAPL